VTEDVDPSRESTSDPFAVLGLARRFDLDESEIERAFLARLGGVHPDLAGEDASLDAAVLTEARATLADPERRAVALLAVLGGPSASQDRSLPDGFLMEMMELRETVEAELGEGGDARARWGAFAEARRSEHQRRVASLFEATAASNNRPELLSRVRLELNAWRYTERLIEQLDPAYDPARADFAE
jgi:molecular chaperone HscB